MQCQFKLTLGWMYKLVYFAPHIGIRIVLEMFCEIQRIAQEYDNVHSTRSIENCSMLGHWEN